jgi:hypothetical protein
LDLPGFFIPSEQQLKEHSMLCKMLSQAMDIPVEKGPNGRDYLACIDHHGFVLTLDFTIKLLNFHERVACQVPCILEGESGVSKTALANMYAFLRNSSHSFQAAKTTVRALEAIEDTMLARGFQMGEGDSSFLRLERALNEDATVTISNSTEMSTLLRDLLFKSCNERSALFQVLPEMFSNDQSASVLEMLHWFASSRLERTFFEINIDSSMDDNDVVELLKPAREAARRLKGVGGLVVVFFDGKNYISFAIMLQPFSTYTADLLYRN